MWDGRREIWGERICISVRLYGYSLALTSPRKLVIKAVLTAPFINFGRRVPSGRLALLVLFWRQRAKAIVCLPKSLSWDGAIRSFTLVLYFL